jgi:hypothetical protein
VKRSIEELGCSALADQVGSRLLDVGAPLAACLDGRDGQERAAALASLRNPWAIEGDPGAFQTTGWRRALRSMNLPLTWVKTASADPFEVVLNR